MEVHHQRTLTTTGWCIDRPRSMSTNAPPASPDIPSSPHRYSCRPLCCSSQHLPSTKTMKRGSWTTPVATGGWQLGQPIIYPFNGTSSSMTDRGALVEGTSVGGASADGKVRSYPFISTLIPSIVTDGSPQATNTPGGRIDQQSSKSTNARATP